jgi:hypothetical protein
MRLKVVRAIVFMASEEIARLCRAFLLLGFFCAAQDLLPGPMVPSLHTTSTGMSAGATHAT